MCVNLCAHMYACIYKQIFNSMDSIPIINDNGSQCLSTDYICGIIAGSSIHLSHLTHKLAPYISAPYHTWGTRVGERSRKLAQGFKLLSIKATYHQT